MRRVTIVEPPESLPLELDPVKLELRIDSTEQDDYVTRLIEAATSFFEETTGYALITRTIESSLRFWPKASNILLPYPPLAEVISVKYYPLGVETDFTDFVVDDYSTKGSVNLLPGDAWPSEVLYPPGIVVQFTAGYGGTGADVPPDILECLMALISFWDETPEAAYVPGVNKTAGKVETLPFSAATIIERYQKRLER